MNKKVKILGKKLIPMWLIAVLLIASGTGAAVGSVLAGKVTGEINVSTTGSAGGLLIGGPYCDIIQHTPNEAKKDNDAAAFQAYSDLDNEMTGTEYLNIAFANEVPDPKYASQVGAAGGNIGQLGFKFYVGPLLDSDGKSNISKIVVSWEGGADTAGVAGGLAVMKGNTSTPEAFADVPTLSDEEVVTITLTGDSITNAVASGYLYVAATSDAGDAQTIYTDYIVATVTYNKIDFSNWTAWNGTEIMEREFPVPNRCIGVHSDDQTGFEAASELGIGDWWLFMLPIKNASNQDITAKLTMEVPSCLNVYVASPDELGDLDPRIHRVTRIGVNSWKFIVDADAEKQDADDYIYIALNAHDDCGPAYYTISGVLEQIPY